MSAVGDRLELTIGPVAHGGVCVARHEGRVVFVRHTLPGERVVARLIDVRSRFARADVIDVLDPSPHRVAPACPYAIPGGCGGCDWQHAAAAYQRQLKSTVVGEQLTRLAGLQREVAVEPTGTDLGWRTRVQFAVDDQGRAGFHPWRSHAVLPVERCAIAHPAVEALDIEGRRWPAARAVEAAVGVATGSHSVLVTRSDGRRRLIGDRRLIEVVRGRRFRLRPTTFWQVHPAAADLLIGAIVSGVTPAPGERVLDLYAGAGLFAAFLAESVGSAGRVVAVEGDRGAAADASVNLAEFDTVEVRRADVTEFLAAAADGRERFDIVVADPPRTGLGPPNARRICALRPRAIGYVACDPAALARDLAVFSEAGYRAVSVRAFDIFPQTHHVECVAILRPEP